MTRVDAVSRLSTLVLFCDACFEDLYKPFLDVVSGLHQQQQSG
jgi:hypothetical protein